MCENPATTRNEISKTLAFNQSAVQKHFEVLRKKGVIERIGKTSDSSWKILIEADTVKNT